MIFFLKYYNIVLKCMIIRDFFYRINWNQTR